MTAEQLARWACLDSPDDPDYADQSDTPDSPDFQDHEDPSDKSDCQDAPDYQDACQDHPDHQDHLLRADPDHPDHPETRDQTAPALSMLSITLRATESQDAQLTTSPSCGRATLLCTLSVMDKLAAKTSDRPGHARRNSAQYRSSAAASARAGASTARNRTCPSG